MKIIVKGRSMEPTMYEGETYKILPVDPEMLKPGDVVVAHLKYQDVVKRISAVYKFGVDLKGDNWKHSTNFDSVPKSKILYKVICPTIWTKLLRRYKKWR